MKITTGRWWVAAVVRLPWIGVVCCGFGVRGAEAARAAALAHAADLAARSA
jgi:hypothetical protein